MDKYVLDASALLALLNRETGHELVADVVTYSTMSSINVSESLTSLQKYGIDIEKGFLMIKDLIAEIIPFDEDQAVNTALLDIQSKKLGLSLGDRACIALALNLKMPVLTADKAWLKLDTSIAIKSIR